MSKDLSKEYKEAVMNDLPDLWGKIEAAIDAGEEQKETETTKKNTPELKIVSNTKNDKVDAARDYVPAKKKKKFPVWIFAAIPSAAILLIAVVPLLFFGGLAATKNSTGTMYDAVPNAVEYIDAAASDDYYVSETAESADWETVAEAEETDEYQKNDGNSNNNYSGSDNKSIDYAAGLENGDRNELTHVAQGEDEGDYDFGDAQTPGTVSEGIVKGNQETAIVDILLIYDDYEETAAFVIVKEVIGDERLCNDNFNGFEVGDCFDAIINPDDGFEELGKYKVVISFIPGKDGIYRIEKIEKISESD